MPKSTEMKCIENLINMIEISEQSTKNIYEDIIDIIKSYQHLQEVEKVSKMKSIENLMCLIEINDKLKKNCCQNIHNITKRYQSLQ